MEIINQSSKEILDMLPGEPPSENTDSKQCISFENSDKSEYIYLVHTRIGTYPDNMEFVLACFKSEAAAKTFAEDHEKLQNEIIANCPVFNDEDYDDIESEEYIKKENEYFQYWEDNRLAMEFNSVFITKMILR
jgi:hypothetical protein